MTKRSIRRHEIDSVGMSRRRFLKGLGACVALPALQSLAANPAVGPMTTATGAPKRMAFMSIPNGVQQDHWFPTGQDKSFVFNATMEPLAPIRQYVQVIAGLNHENATTGKDGNGDHARSNATFLTGARARKTAGNDIHLGISVDQVVAQEYGHLTRFPSLELSCDAIRNSGRCDSGYACAYQYNLSWSSPTTPVTPEPDPRLVFERLFGSGKHGERQKNYRLRQRSDRSILDFVLDDAKSVQRELGVQDKRKLDEYLSGVRSIEKRIRTADKFAETPDPQQSTPAGIPGNFGDHMEIMYDLLALAFQTDSTRVATLLLSYDGSNRAFPDLNITEGHHYLSHSQQKPKLAKKVAEIDRYYMVRFARFLEKLANTEDVDGNSVLHNSMIVYGGGISDGNRHQHDNLPVVLAGSGGGVMDTGRYLQLETTPMSNLFLSMLGHFGVRTQQFGDSTGRLEQI